MPYFYDTLLGEYIKNPGQRGLSLDKISERYFDYKMISYGDVTEKGKINFKNVELEKAAIYSGEDVYITAKILQKQKEEKIFDNRILREIEIPLVEVLKKMEINGVKISRDELKGIGILLKQEIDFLEKKIYVDVGEQFNINSPKQVGKILFDKLGLDKGKKTKTGWSVSADILGELAHSYPVAQDIVDYRHYTKILSTYVDGLLNIADENNLVHTSYNQTVTTTGRLSSTNPNLQNIPSSDGIAGEVRRAFVSRWENGHIMAADYSQVEVRLLAMISGDENLIGAFKSGVDIHHKTAEFIFNNNHYETHSIGKEEVTRHIVITASQRKIAKAVNFGVIYGLSAFGLSKMIGISQKDAKVYIDKFFESYPKVKDYINSTIRFCEENGYVETLFGRKRYINNINDSNRIIKQSAEREAINMPIQGTNADIIKIAMIKIADFLKTPLKISPITQEVVNAGYKLKSTMIMQVHDELVFDLYPGEEQVLQLEVRKIMEGILENYDFSLTHYKLDKDKLVDLKVDINIGENWRETK